MEEGSAFTSVEAPDSRTHEALDGLEFARGASDSKWGSVRAAMGHPEPFDLKYVAVGNEDCWKKNYRDSGRKTSFRTQIYVLFLPGNYLKFYDAIKRAYPDIKIISNCDGSSYFLDHPADYYDFHIYTSASHLFSMTHQFDHTSRSGPKAFVSEYAVTGKDAGTGSLLAALAKAGFLIGLEKNRFVIVVPALLRCYQCNDIVEMASYAPLFVNDNDRRWNPDAIVFNSSMHYGTPSYWVQKFFRESSGATLLDANLQTNSSSLVASAITWTNSVDGETYLKIKANVFSDCEFWEQARESRSFTNLLHLFLHLGECHPAYPFRHLHVMQVVPDLSLLENADKEMNIIIAPYSLTSLDLLTESNSIRMPQTDSSARSSI
ncbi:hypothetical protein POTOM_024647 [Populus tomentosa]|uniref:Alpha-L-arabinofuranosidase C-terminal domain-containing protein n=1 Tax=Populus tomentosa TaxID=118781 RepID=A0A8X7ZJL8_POPTO|nr:hypothetical protein POTOM_024647 [Populus tomentosa]